MHGSENILLFNVSVTNSQYNNTVIISEGHKMFLIRFRLYNTWFSIECDVDNVSFTTLVCPQRCGQTWIENWKEKHSKKPLLFHLSFFQKEPTTKHLFSEAIMTLSIDQIVLTNFDNAMRLNTNWCKNSNQWPSNISQEIRDLSKKKI